MPNIVYLWDFEDGTTQGWTLGPYTSIDANSKIQGKYSLKYSKYLGSIGNINDLFVSISGIDLSTVSKPIIVFMLKDESGSYKANHPGQIGIVVKDSNGTVLLDKTIQIAYSTYGFMRIIAVDLSPVAGKSGLVIEIREKGSYIIACTRTHYVDVIAIIDGADYEYSTGVVAFNNVPVTVDLSIPDSDISSLSAVGVGVSLATPDWDHNVVKFTASTDQGSATIDSGNDNTKNTSYTAFSASPTQFSSISIYAEITDTTSYAGWDEKIVAVFIDTAYSYKAVYLFNIHFTVNGINPQFCTAIYTTTYGTSIAGQKDFSVKIHASTLDAAVKAKYLVGDNTAVTSGSITLEVWDSGLSTQYGSVSIDLTTDTEAVSQYITGLPTDADLVFRIKWAVQASARVVIMVTPVFKVS